MPTIEFSKNLFDTLIGRNVPLDELESYLSLAKAEFKAFDEEDSALKIELNDTNRPDLWSPEGLARQIRTWLEGYRYNYPFFDEPVPRDQRIEVSPELQSIRPYIGGFTATGVSVTEDMLIGLIQSQEKLAENFGRKRLSLSLGIYELDALTFPLRYVAADPDTTAFVPLGEQEPMTLRKILEKHPKGVEYKGLLEGYTRFPYFVDAVDGVLSFPPIINSRRSGEIKPGESRLFIEATGIDFQVMLLGLTIFACNLADLGFTIKPVEVHYPFDTPLGRKLKTPHRFACRKSLSVNTLNKALGIRVDEREVIEVLTKYGVDAQMDGDRIVATLPPYRLDYLHTVDVIEDYAMSKGYNYFEPLMPEDFTVGRLSPGERFSDKIRDLMVGYGFEEIISNILISKEELTERMEDEDAKVVELANPMSLAHASLRHRILPSLLRVEAGSAMSAYPHRLFETGDAVVHHADSPMEWETVTKLAVIIAHPNATFSEMDSYLNTLFFHLKLDYVKEPAAVSGYINGRVGKVIVDSQVVGVIGELTPSLLERWGIGVPVSAMELDLSTLLALCA